MLKKILYHSHNNELLNIVGHFHRCVGGLVGILLEQSQDGLLGHDKNQLRHNSKLCVEDVLLRCPIYDYF
jgi:hypothetical protein